MNPKPQTVSELFPSKWLRAEDLGGRSCVLTVSRCTVEEVRSTITNQDEWRAILDFGRSKRLVLNKTQCAAMIQITGSETFAHWVGARIMLAPGRARNGKPTIDIMRPPEPEPVEKPANGQVPATTEDFLNT